MRMEAGVSKDKFIFYARFHNEKSKPIVTKGELEVELFQDDKIFFQTKMKVDPDHFIPFGTMSRQQFRSEPFEVASFRFEPRINQLGWYDHKLKARYTDEKTGKVFEFTGGHTFQENPISLPKGSR